jgi:hypothetical protein
MKIQYKFLLVFLTITYFTENASAQYKLITGKVIDEEGKPIAHALILPTDSFVVYSMSYTENDGTYTISVPNKNEFIMCRHVGFVKKKEKIEGNTIINFVLTKQIEEPLHLISVVGTHKYTKNELKKKKEEELAKREAQKLAKNKVHESEVVAPPQSYRFVEQLAEPMGGHIALKEYLNKVIIYPDSANISNVRGTVKVSFVIDKYGFPKNIMLIKGVNKYTDDLVLNAIIKMPAWYPARENGNPVEENKEISVSFDIKGIE